MKHLISINENESNNIRKASDNEIEVFLFLNDLRESGITNMFGASPYIEDEFGYDRRTSMTLLSAWMDNFNDDGNYDDIKTDKIDPIV